VAFDAASEVLPGALTTNPGGNGHVVARDAFPIGTRRLDGVVKPAASGGYNTIQPCPTTPSATIVCSFCSGSPVLR
jgi:hypothetical protein